MGYQENTMGQHQRAETSQLALTWLLAKRDDIVPIPGSRNPKRVAENAAAEVKLPPLTISHRSPLSPHNVRTAESGGGRR